MDAISEAIVITSDGGTSSCTIYDLKTQNVLHTFKEGKTVLKGLALIREDYILSALKDEKAMNIRTISKNSETSKMPMPGSVSCVAVTDYGDYCVGAIDKSIHLWQVSTGHKIDTLSCHSQPITCLKFSSDGTYIISGGKDGLVLVWLLSTALDGYADYDTKPHFVWMDHSLEIADIAVGKLGLFARVVTASRDMTCRIYELETGSLLNTVCTDCEINAVTLDNTEYFLTLGCNDGNIYRINLFGTRDGEVLHPISDSKFAGHKKAITCLSVSTFGKYLLSGSEDCTCKLWNMSNFTCMKTMTFEGTITNAIITLTPPGLKVSGNYIPRFIAKSLEKSKREPLHWPKMMVSDKSLSLMHIETPDEYFDQSMLQESEDVLSRQPQVSMKDLENINLQLYSYALSDLAFKTSGRTADTE